MHAQTSQAPAQSPGWYPRASQRIRPAAARSSSEAATFGDTRRISAPASSRDGTRRDATPPAADDDDAAAPQAEPQQVRIHGSFGLSELVGHARGIEGGDVTQRARRALHQGQGQHGAGALAEPQPQVYQRA